MGNSASNLPPLKTVECETSKMLGKWFVIGVKPTYLEVGMSNSIEQYTKVEGKPYDVAINNSFNKAEPMTSSMTTINMKAYIQGDKSKSGLWKVSPFFPVKAPNPFIEVDDVDYSWVVVGFPSRAYCWKRRPSGVRLTLRLSRRNRVTL